LARRRRQHAPAAPLCDPAPPRQYCRAQAAPPFSCPARVLGACGRDAYPIRGACRRDRLRAPALFP
ncbi:unnamed protein product, partial [Amoebophrya sp. A120]